MGIQRLADAVCAHKLNGPLHEFMQIKSLNVHLIKPYCTIKVKTDVGNKIWKPSSHQTAISPALNVKLLKKLPKKSAT